MHYVLPKISTSLGLEPSDSTKKMRGSPSLPDLLSHAPEPVVAVGACPGVASMLETEKAHQLFIGVVSFFQESAHVQTLVYRFRLMISFGLSGHGLSWGSLRILYY